MGHVLSTLWVGFISRFPTDILRTSISPCAFTHSGTGRMETQRSKAEVGQRSHGGGQVLAEVVLCAVPLSYYPRGDDCAIYCLAGAGDRRRWKETVRFELIEKNIYDGLITSAETISLLMKYSFIGLALIFGLVLCLR